MWSQTVSPIYRVHCWACGINPHRGRVCRERGRHGELGRVAGNASGAQSRDACQNQATPISTATARRSQDLQSNVRVASTSNKISAARCRGATASIASSQVKYVHGNNKYLDHDGGRRQVKSNQVDVHPAYPRWRCAGSACCVPAPQRSAIPPQPSPDVCQNQNEDPGR
jgi:hypothetical protein